jgi:hypothetical protein
MTGTRLVRGTCAWMLRVALVACAASAGTSSAADAAPGDASATGAPVLRDPWLPPSVRKSAATSAPSPTGTALKTQAIDKLRASFMRADVDGVGTITREQARAAGLGLVVARFDAIDPAGRGRIGFDDFLRYLRAQGADL